MTSQIMKNIIFVSVCLSSTAHAWRVVLCGLLAARTQAFAPAPIRWEGLPSKRFVLASASPRSMAFVPPQKLTITDHSDESSLNSIPSFTARPDKTIIWDYTGWCLEAAGTHTGDAIHVNSCNGGQAQRWNLLPSSNGWHSGRTQIQLQNTNLCLSCLGVGAHGALQAPAIELRQCANATISSWKFEDPRSMPVQGLSQLHAFPSSLRHWMATFILLVVLGGLALQASLFRWQTCARAFPMKRGAMILNVDDGGVCLTLPLVMPQCSVPAVNRLTEATHQIAFGMFVSKTSAKDSSTGKGSGQRDNTVHRREVEKPPFLSTPGLNDTAAVMALSPVADAKSLDMGMPLEAPFLARSRAMTPRRVPSVVLQASEPTLQDFAITGGPVIVSATGFGSSASDVNTHDSERLRKASTNVNDALADVEHGKPVLIFLPGIELTGYSFHRQIPELANDFEVRYLSTSKDDRTGFSSLAEVVRTAIDAEYEATGRPTYLIGESFGAVLALQVALGGSAPPEGLAGLALINPATSVTKSWPSNLGPVLDSLAALPAGLSDAAYAAIATPLLIAISTPTNPLQLGGRFEDDKLPAPLRFGAALARLVGALPLTTELTSFLTLPTLAFRLSMLLQAARDAEQFKYASLTLPVQVFASSADRVLPSVSEGRRLARKLPNAKLTVLKESGHAPLLEVRVRLAELLREAKLTERQPRRKKDYVSDFRPPSAEQFAQASEGLLNIRKLTSPIFLSTDSMGKRIVGLGGLPPLPNRSDLYEKTAGQTPDAIVESTPPVLFVGNHQLYGFLDIPIVIEEIHRQTGVLVRGLAHPVVFESTRASDGDGGDGDGVAVRGGFVDYETFGTVPVTPRALFKLLSRGENAFLYPGGVREAFKSTKNGEKYQLFWPPASEGSDFVRVAARFGATVVPVASIGSEEGFEMLLDAEELLNIPYLGERAAEAAKDTPTGRVGEQFVAPVSVPKVPGRFYFLFGRPFETSTISASDKEACATLYSNVQAELEDSLRYLLEKRKKDPWESVLPRTAVEAVGNWKRQVPTFKQ